MSDDIIYKIVDAAGGAALRLGQMLGTEAQIKAIARRLGWQLDTVPPALPALGTSLRVIGPSLIAARQDPTNPVPWLALMEAIANAATALSALSQTDFGAELAALNFGVEFSEQILHWAVIEHLSREFPRVLGVLRATGIAVTTTRAAASGRVAYADERFVLPDFTAVLDSPTTLLRAAWAWGDPAFDGGALLDEIAAAFRSAGVTAGYALEPAGVPEQSGQDAGSSRWRLVTRLLVGSDAGGTYELGLRWLVLDRDGLPALAIVPYVVGALAATVPLGADLTLAITGMATAGDQRAIVISPTSIDLVDNFLAGGTGTTAGAQLALAVRPTAPTTTALTAGDAGGTTLGAWTLQVLASGSETSTDIALELSFATSSLGLATGGSGVLGSAGVGSHADVPIPITIGVSARRGVYLGDAGRSLPALGPIVLGPVQLRDATLSLTGVDSGFAVTLTTNAVVQVGPATITLAGIGAALTARFPGSGGNLGPLDLGATVIPPTGGAVAIDSAIVTGGGAITHVAGRDYRGAFVFQILGVSVAAIGVLDDTPQGNGAFVAIAGASFPSIQLGWGFTLDGIGGVIATHRQLDVDEVRANLARGAASSLLDFDLAGGNLISRVDALATAFPPMPGRFVVGPTFRIGWGTPGVLQADLAILLELPDPIQLVLLGAMQLGLPTLAARVVDLRVDVLGVLDFARKTLAVDATLHDSKLAGYPVTGALALRMGWGDQPEFLLAIGGFHPQFTPPPGFPTVPRLALTAGDNPQLRLDAYLAVTSNTAQVGAQADLTYHGGGFDITAQAGFDALFVFEPFQFDVDISASAAIAWHGHNLASIALDLTLTGPHPWHAVGSASFGILWWNVSVGFDSTWGDATPAALPPPPDVASTLRQALADPSAWSSELPPDEPGWLVLVSPTPVAKLHPLGAVLLRQRVVPLGLDITEYGNSPLPAALHFAIGTVTIGGVAATTTQLDDAFAPAQFTQMTTDERLAAPSFERMASGVELAATAVTVGPSTRASLQTDTLIIDALAARAAVPRTAIPMGFASVLAATRATPPPPLRTGPRLADIGYVLASTTTLATTGTATTFAAARSARTTGLQVIPIAHAG